MNTQTEISSESTTVAMVSGKPVAFTHECVTVHEWEGERRKYHHTFRLPVDTHNDVKTAAAAFGYTVEKFLERLAARTLPHQPDPLKQGCKINKIVFANSEWADVLGACARFNGEGILDLVREAMRSTLEMYLEEFIFGPDGEVVFDAADLNWEKHRQRFVGMVGEEVAA